LQTQGYHLLPVADLLGGYLGAPWIVTTWGSDIFYFQKFPEHLGTIKRLLGECDYLIPDCRRDEALARTYGFRGNVPFILPGSGGYPVEEMRRQMAPGTVSGRRLIMLKAIRAGRALSGCLEALERRLMAGTKLSYSPGHRSGRAMRVGMDCVRASSLHRKILSWPRGWHWRNVTDGVPMRC
jgi:hypothetical protein